MNPLQFIPGLQPITNEIDKIRRLREMLSQPAPQPQQQEAQLRTANSTPLAMTTPMSMPQQAPQPAPTTAPKQQSTTLPSNAGASIGVGANTSFSKGGMPIGSNNVSAVNPTSNPQDISAFANSLYASLGKNTGLTYQNPTAGMSAIDQLSALQAQQANEKVGRTGLYAMDRNAGFSPGQIGQQEGSADQFYQEQLGKYGAMAQAELANLRAQRTQSQSQGSEIMDILLSDGRPPTDDDIATTNIILGLSRVSDKKTLASALSKATTDEQRMKLLANQALRGLAAEDRTKFYNNVNALGSIRKAISLMEKGVQTGAIPATKQYAFNLIGKDFDPQLAQIGSLITQSLQPYRSNVTGAAWGEQEDAEYQSLFGSTKFEPEELLQRLRMTEEMMKRHNYNYLSSQADTLGAIEGESFFTPKKTESNITPDEIQGLIDLGWKKEDIDNYIDQLSFNSVGNTTASNISNLSRAIAKQESGMNYSAVNKDSGALGKYQMMPATLRGLGYNVSAQEFLSNPRLQDEAHNKLMAELNNRYNGNLDKILADYYGGPRVARIVGTPAADRRQGPNGEYPSVNEYVAQVKQKLQLT